MDETGLGRFILEKLEKLDDKVDDIRIENAEVRKSFDLHERKDEDRHEDIKQMNNAIISQLNCQSDSLKEYNLQLKEHIKRTEILEKRQDEFSKSIKPIVDKENAKVILNKHLTVKLTKNIKILTMVSLVIGILSAVFKTFFM